MRFFRSARVSGDANTPRVGPRAAGTKRPMITGSSEASCWPRTNIVIHCSTCWVIFFLINVYSFFLNSCLLDHEMSVYNHSLSIFFLIRVSQGEHLARCNVYLILNDFKNCYSTFNYVIKWLIFSQQPCQWTSCYDSLTIGWSQCMNDVTNFRKIYWRKQLLKICWRHQFSTIWPTLPIFKEEIKECWRQQFIKMY